MSRDDSLQATTEGVKGKRAQQEGSIREKLLRILLGVATKKRNVVPDGVEHAVRTNNRWHLPRPHHSQQRVELMQQWLVTPANRYSHHRTLRPMSHPQLLSCKSFAQQSCSMQLGLSHSATMSHKKNSPSWLVDSCLCHNVAVCDLHSCMLQLCRAMKLYDKIAVWQWPKSFHFTHSVHCNCIIIYPLTSDKADISHLKLTHSIECKRSMCFCDFDHLPLPMITKVIQRIFSLSKSSISRCKQKYIGHPYCWATMYVGSVTCCPLVSHSEYANETGRRTDATPLHYAFC